MHDLKCALPGEIKLHDRAICIAVFCLSPVSIQNITQKKSTKGYTKSFFFLPDTNNTNSLTFEQEWFLNQLGIGAMQVELSPNKVPDDQNINNKYYYIL